MGSLPGVVGGEQGGTRPGKKVRFRRLLGGVPICWRFAHIGFTFEGISVESWCVRAVEPPLIDLLKAAYYLDWHAQLEYLNLDRSNLRG